MAQPTAQPTPTWIREHNRKVLRELQLDSTKWLSVPRAIRALVPVVGSALLQAAAELHKRMRNPSDAMPAATRSVRLRDGLQISHVITRYPPPAYWDAVPLESLIAVMGFREINEGDGNVLRCWDFVDLQCFNRWLSALAAQAEQAKQEPLIESAVWFEEALVRYPRRRGEKITDYTKRLSGEMQGAPVTRVWPPDTMRRRYHEKVAQDAKEKERKIAQQKRQRNL